MLNKKKILIISPIFPYPLESGGQVRIYNVIKHLSDNFEVSLLSPIESSNRESVSEMKRFCRNVETIPVQIDRTNFEKFLFLLNPSQLSRNFKRISQWIQGTPFKICRFYHPGMENILEKMIRKGKYDIVQAVYCQMAPYLLRAKELDKNVTSSLVDIDLSFISKYREYSAKKGIARILSFLEYRRMKNYVTTIWPKFDYTIAMSEVDKEKLLSLNSELNIIVSPNGVDINYFRPFKDRKPKKNRLAFLGGSNHHPNVDALLYFNSEIFPKVHQYNSDISLTVIGNFAVNLIPNTNNHIKFTGFVDDFRPVLNDCAILVVPIRIGGGTRLKVLEAMALGIPVVSTSIGCEGIVVENNKDIIIADTDQDFADGILAVLKTKQLYQSLAKNGKKLIEEKYSWQKIVSRLEDVYQKD